MATYENAGSVEAAYRQQPLPTVGSTTQFKQGQSGVMMESRPQYSGQSTFHVKKTRNNAGVKAQKSHLVLNGKPFLMTVGGQEEIKVFETSQTMISGVALPTSGSGESSLERVKISKKMMKNKAYLQPLANGNEDTTYAIPANGWARADSIKHLKNNNNNLSLPDNTSSDIR